MDIILKSLLIEKVMHSHSAKGKSCILCRKMKGQISSLTFVRMEAKNYNTKLSPAKKLLWGNQNRRNVWCKRAQESKIKLQEN